MHAEQCPTCRGQHQQPALPVALLSELLAAVLALTISAGQYMPNPGHADLSIQGTQ
jgi:hypothetical protein